ncbi:MAG: CHAT domain-containing protein [Deltaproteobacteria bacterium]|nr:CHAT domain-containing protein [Deltaproteobacteria bacterium]
MVRRPPWIWLVLAFGLLAAAVYWRWARPDAPVPPSAAAMASRERPASAPLEVSLAGCSTSVRVPATCRVQPDAPPLRLWVGAAAAPRVRVDGKQVEPEALVQTEDPGWRLRVAVPPDARTLEVEHADGTSRWSVAIEPAAVVPRVRAVFDALPPDVDPQREAAYRRAVETLRTLHDPSTDEAIAAQRLLGKLTRQLGQPDTAAEATATGFDLAMAHGRNAEAVALGLLLVPMRDDQGDERGAKWALDAVGAALPTVLDAEAEGLWSYFSAGQAKTEQDRTTALRHYATAQRIARRLGLVDLELSATTQELEVLGLLGRRQEQRAAMERMLGLMEPLPQLSCKHAVYLNGAGWSMLLAARPGESTEGARRLMQRAERIHGPKGGCEVGHHPDWRDNLATLRLNLALEALHRGAPHDVQQQLDALVPDQVSPGLVPWLGYVRARLARMQAEPERALEYLAAVEADPRIGWDPLLPWQAAVLRGDVERTAGRTQPALDAYLLAEQRIEQLVRTVGIDQGREGLLAGVHTSAAAAIDLLLLRGDVERAATVARASRARALRPMGRTGVLARLPTSARETWRRERARYRALAGRLEAELADAWRLPADAREGLQREHARTREAMRGHLDEAYRALSEAADPADAVLPLPRDGELWLVMHPLPRGWVVFGLSATDVVAHRVPSWPSPDDRTAVAAAVLEPFAAMIDDAELVVVLPMGSRVDLAVHGLPWREDVLLATVPVVYKLDIAEHPAPRPTTSRGLVISDPATRRADLGRLPAAAEEGAAVEAALTRRGWAVVRLDGEAATHGAVTEAMEGVDLVHYAGHGERGGLEGWDSALPLAGEASLDVRDVLALPRAPSTVVLSGCETGLGDDELNSGGMHLAGAFLMAGSTHVVAAAAQVPDALASALGRAMYEDERPPQSDAVRLQRALLSLRNRPEPWARDWEVYRGFVP